MPSFSKSPLRPTDCEAKMTWMGRSSGGIFCGRKDKFIKGIIPEKGRDCYEENSVGEQLLCAENGKIRFDGLSSMKKAPGRKIENVWL